MFAGFAIGQLFAGPLSDGFGRKPVIYAGYFIFIIGCIISMLADDLTTMLIGHAFSSRAWRGGTPHSDHVADP